MGKCLIGSRTAGPSWPRAKYSLALADLTQSISMLSFDCCVCVFFRWSKPVSMSTLSSRAWYAFPALSLDVYVPHTGLVFHVVYQQNCTQGCTGHIIIKYYSYHYSYLLPLLSGSTLGSSLLVSIFVRPDLQLWKSQWHSLQKNANVSISRRLYFSGPGCSNIGEHYPLDKSPSSG